MSGNYETTTNARLQQLRANGEATVLAIETSCDETAAAVVKNGRTVLSNVIYSQIPLHQKYGGVVPEVASRNHVTQLTPVVTRAMEEAGVSFAEIDAIAVTARPGLVGALLTGVSYAKGLSFARSLPLIGVDHIAGHIAANYLSHPQLTPPFTCLVASGGHSHIFQVADYQTLALLGCTRDDAAGEAFDKIARVIGLPYPGGPALEKLAKTGDPHAIPLPGGFNAEKGLDFSFSGLKTAVINYLHTAKQRGESVNHADIAASFQHTVIAVLAAKSVQAARNNNSTTLALAGGVSANRALDTALRTAAGEAGLAYVSPALCYCGDNAAMIGCAGYYALIHGERDNLSLNARARR